MTDDGCCGQPASPVDEDVDRATILKNLCNRRQETGNKTIVRLRYQRNVSADTRRKRTHNAEIFSKKKKMGKGQLFLNPTRAETHYFIFEIDTKPTRRKRPFYRLNYISPRKHVFFEKLSNVENDLLPGQSASSYALMQILNSPQLRVSERFQSDSRICSTKKRPSQFQK
jgi:hypothetical protein